MPDVIAWDFSWSKPTIAQLRAAGVSRVIVYLARDGRGITRLKLAEYYANNIEVAFVYERGSGANLTLGFAEGVSCARDANSIAEDVGAPADAVIFYADDINDPYSQQVWNNIDAFVQGAISVGRRGVGVYAEADVLIALAKIGRTPFLWETGAYSYSDYRHCPQAVLRQLGNRVTPITAGLASNAVDDNIVFAGDWGQTPRPATQPRPPTQEDDMAFTNWPQKDQDALVTAVADRVNLAVGNALKAHLGDILGGKASVSDRLDAVLVNVDPVGVAAGNPGQGPDYLRSEVGEIKSKLGA